MPQRPEFHSVGEGLGRAGRQGPATHLDEEPIGGDPPGRQLVGQLEAEGSAAVDSPRVLGSLAAEGKRPVGHRLAKPHHARVASLAFSTFTHPNLGAQVLESAQDPLVGPCGDVHGQWPSGRPSHRGGGQRCVPARGYGQRRVDREAIHLEVDGQAEEVPGLVAPRDVSRLVLGPQPPGLSDCLGQVVEWEQRGSEEAVTVDLGHCLVEASDQVYESCVGDTGLPGSVVGPQQLAVAEEGIGADPGLLIVGRPGGAGRCPKPAFGASRGAHPSSSRPVWALNSSIRASQAGASPWTWRQKA